MTNWHNITGRNQQTGQPLLPSGAVPNEVVITHNRANLLGQWVARTEPLYNNNGQPLWIEHPGLGARADFVALPLTQMGDVQLYPYTLGVGDPTILVAPAEVVSVVGFPLVLRQVDLLLFGRPDSSQPTMTLITAPFRSF